MDLQRKTVTFLPSKTRNNMFSGPLACAQISLLYLVHPPVSSYIFSETKTSSQLVCFSTTKFARPENRANAGLSNSSSNQSPICFQANSACAKRKQRKCKKKPSFRMARQYVSPLTKYIKEEEEESQFDSTRNGVFSANASYPQSCMFSSSLLGGGRNSIRFPILLHSSNKSDFSVTIRECVFDLAGWLNSGLELCEFEYTVCDNIPA